MKSYIAFGRMCWIKRVDPPLGFQHDIWFPSPGTFMEDLGIHKIEKGDRWIILEITQIIGDRWFVTGHILDTDVIVVSYLEENEVDTFLTQFKILNK